MADDPRIEPLAQALFEETRPAWSWDRPPTGGHEAQQQFWRDRAATLLYTQLDSADPLRTMLADEDRAEQLLRRAIADPGQFLRRAGWGTSDAETITSWSARAVLAALRQVARNG